MTYRPLSLVALVAFLFSVSAPAQTPADNTAMTFGNKLSLASITSALQSAGYQALVSRAANAPESLLGVIATGVNGVKFNIYVIKCDNSKTDEVCMMTLVISFTDDKNIVNDALLATMNQKTALVKVIKVIRPADNKVMMNVTYSFPTKDIEDSKFIPSLMQSYGQDVARVAAAYNAAAQPPAPPPAGK